MRWNVVWIAAESVLTDNVLARPGTPSSKHVPVRQQPDQQPFDEILLADDDLADLADQHPHKFAFAFDLFVNRADSLFHCSFLLRFTTQKQSF